MSGSIYVADGAHITSFADAIRAKAGYSSSLVWPSDFISGIRAIQVSNRENEIINGTVSGRYENTGVSYIGVGRFCECSSLTEGIFPLCGYINDRAFEKCTSLSFLSASLCSAVYRSAFKDCTALLSVNITSCKIVSECAFQNCMSLQSINLPNCQSVSSSAFQGCSSISYVSLPSCTKLGNMAFEGCTNLRSIELPNYSFPSSASSCFENCTSLSFVSLPICTSIGYRWFYGCYSLASIYAPSALSIGQYAFAGCAFESFSFSKIISIGGGAFQSCVNLKYAYIGFSSVDNWTFNDCIKLSYVEMPNCVSVSNNAFDGCTLLSSVYAPILYSISGAAFSGCGFSSIYFPCASTVSASAFNNNVSLRYACLPATRLVWHIFSNCNLLSSVYMPNARLIYSSAFLNNIGLKTVVIGNNSSSAGRIYANAFASCYNLLSFYILSGQIVLSANNAFYSTPISNYTAFTDGIYGSIYILSSLYSYYISSTNWVNYSARMVSITLAEADALFPTYLNTDIPYGVVSMVSTTGDYVSYFSKSVYFERIPTVSSIYQLNVEIGTYTSAGALPFSSTYTFSGAIEWPGYSGIVCELSGPPKRAFIKLLIESDTGLGDAFVLYKVDVGYTSMYARLSINLHA